MVLKLAGLFRWGWVPQLQDLSQHHAANSPATVNWKQNQWDLQHWSRQFALQKWGSYCYFPGTDVAQRDLTDFNLCLPAFQTIHSYTHYQVPSDKLQHGSRSPAHFSLSLFLIFFLLYWQRNTVAPITGSLMRHHSCVAALLSAINNSANPSYTQHNLHSILVYNTYWYFDMPRCIIQMCICFNKHIDLLSQIQCVSTT